MTKEKTAWELAGDAEGNDVGGDGARGCDEVRSGKLLALRTRKRGDAAADARVRAAAEWRLGKRRAARQKREDEPHQAGPPLAGGHVGHPARLAGAFLAPGEAFVMFVFFSLAPSGDALVTLRRRRDDAEELDGGGRRATSDGAAGRAASRTGTASRGSCDGRA